MAKRPRNSDCLREILQKEHEKMWLDIQYCHSVMDDTYFEMLCTYLLLYILYGTRLKFENPIMQNTLIKFRRAVDHELGDVKINAASVFK